MSNQKLSEEEVVATFMEKKPNVNGLMSASVGWWVLHAIAKFSGEVGGVSVAYLPRDLTLDALHEVEAKLSDRQRQYYCALIFQRCCGAARTMNPIEDLLTPNRWGMIHTSAAQKISALAQVLRPEVEK